MNKLASAFLLIACIFVSANLYAQAPGVMYTSPEHFAQNVALDTTISVTFNTDIEPATLNSTSFVVYGSLTGRHFGTISYSGINFTGAFQSSKGFEYGEKVTVILTTAIESFVGTPLAEPFIWTFTVLSSEGPAAFSSFSTYPVGSSTQSIEAADLDDDGDIDLVAASINILTIYVMLNDGYGRFRPAGTYMTGFRPMGIELADIDQDDDVDIIAAVNDDAEIVTFLNNGGASFTQSGNCPAGLGAASLCAVDFDGDGDLDVATGDYEADSISILINDGAGNYTLAYQKAAGDQPSDIIACDLDGDNDLDLAVSNRSWRTARTISLYFNDGNGLFGDQVIYDAYGYPSGIACGDLDTDGDLDLVVCEGNYSDGILVYMNDGGGNFDPYVAYLVDQTPHDLSISDFDGDGHLDVASANYYYANVSIRLNNGDGSLADQNQYHCGFMVYDMTSSDFNGDGAIDLATTSSSSEIVVLLNQSEISVTNLDDDGVGSLRRAIETANADSSIRNIVFDVVDTIKLQSPLPAIVSEGGVAIRGGSTPDSWMGQEIILDGSDMTAGNGIEIGSSGNMIDWLKIINFPGNGVVVYGEDSKNNSITGNSIYNNGLLGIDLGGDGVTENDVGDFDTGPNDLFNYPVLDSLVAVYDTTFFAYGRTAPYSRVDMFWVNPWYEGDLLPPDISGHGEAFSLLGQTHADADGKFIFEYIEYLSWDINEYAYLTFTSTDTMGNTSELSENYGLTGKITITAHSDVNLWITDPYGNYIGKDAFGVLYQTLDHAEYIEEPPDSPDIIELNNPFEGNYLIEIVTENGADPGNSYAVGIAGRYTDECMLVVDRMVPGAFEKDSLYFSLKHYWHYINGDADRNEETNILDVTYIINYLYKGGPAPEPVDAADVNCNLKVNILDVTHLINYLYKDGPTPCEHN